MRAHLAGQDDQLVKVAPLLAMIPDWCAFRNAPWWRKTRDIRRHALAARPLGDESFLARLEGMVGRVLQRNSADRKRKQGEKKAVSASSGNT